MTTEVLIAVLSVCSSVITGALALIGVVISNRSAQQKMQAELEKNQAVQEAKIDELTREIREHNNFAKRMPVVEEQIRVINHRIGDIEDELKRSE